jgi:hypothetical protein
MTTMRRYLNGLFGLVLLICATDAAQAACKVTSVSSITGLSSNFTYLSATTPWTQTTLTVTVTVNTTGTGGPCHDILLGFKSTTATPSMIGPSTPKLLYDAFASGNSLIYTGAAPNPGSALQLTFKGNGPATSPSTQTVTSTFLVRSTGNQTVPNGLYNDSSLTAVIWNTNATAIIPGPQPPLLVSATVNNPRSCTVGGSAKPSAGTATIPISTTGRVASFAPITPKLSNTDVSCTGLGAASIDLSSLNGRLTGPANTNASFANAIDYTATASVTGGSLTATAASYVSSTGVSTPGLSTNLGSGAVTGNLVVSVTPVDPGKPLLAGSYSDTLTVRILPQ